MGGTMNNDSVSVHILEVSNMRLEQRNWMLNKELTEAHRTLAEATIKLVYIKEYIEKVRAEPRSCSKECYDLDEIYRTLGFKL